jgi:hypothetical protein
MGGGYFGKTDSVATLVKPCGFFEQPIRSAIGDREVS